MPSLFPKLDELHSYCLCESPDIIVITGSWLSPVVYDHEVCIQGYGVLRKDRDRHGGGVAVYVKDSIPYKCLQLIHQDLKAVLVVCSLNSQLFTIAAFYPPPPHLPSPLLVPFCYQNFIILCPISDHKTFLTWSNVATSMWTLS